MEFIKKFLGFVMLLVSVVVGFCFVMIATAGVGVEFAVKLVSEEWFLKLFEHVTKWGVTVLLVLGLSRMLAINNKVACFITFVLWALLSAVIVLSLNFPEEYADLLNKIGLLK